MKSFIEAGGVDALSNVSCTDEKRNLDVRVSQFRFATPSTETSQHCAVSRAELQRPNCRSWRGEAAARLMKSVRSAVENRISMGWVGEVELRLVAHVVLDDGYCWKEERKSALYLKFPLKVLGALPNRKR